MLKIGDFSRVAHVTVKALRHYGQIGLLNPAWVDRFSGYRYYSFDQLPRVNRILALKDMGFTLEQIAGMLDRDLDMDELRSILHHKRLEVEAHLLAEQARLVQVETRLEQIEQSGGLGNYEVVLKSVPKLPVVSARQVLADLNQAEQWSRRMRREITASLRAQGLRPTGQWMHITHNTDYAERNIDLQVAVVVDLAAYGKPAPRKQLVFLPAAPFMACVVHSGPAWGFSGANTALYAWIQSNGYRQAAPVREVCHADPEIEEAGCEIIELQMPVEKASYPSASSLNGSTQEEQKMEPKFVTKPAFMLVGMKYFGKNQHQEISELWRKFSPYIGTLVEKPIRESFGWCGMMQSDGNFEYIAAVETTKAENLPEWAVVRMVPESTYAVFPHRGSLETLRDTYNFIYQTWLPQSGYTTASYDMEAYNDEFKDFATDSVMYIYIPVNKK